jgi:hypothetical protein
MFVSNADTQRAIIASTNTAERSTMLAIEQIRNAATTQSVQFVPQD